MFITRSQADSPEDFDRIASECAITFDHSADCARQEFRDEVDVNRIVQAHTGLGLRAPEYGEYDFRQDSTDSALLRRSAREALEALEEARRPVPGTLPPRQGVDPSEPQKGSGGPVAANGGLFPDPSGPDLVG